MAARGIILGDWTHRRADAGGTRAVSADVSKARPDLAWTWSPDHRGRVDQVRIGFGCIFVATMRPADASAPGWEHPVVYAIDAQTGDIVAERELPDPVPVAAMMIAHDALHVVATRRGEPIFWYALSTPSLTPKHRKLVDLDRDARREDVLDAWCAPDGGLWLEIEGALGGTGGRAYAFVGEADGVVATQTHEQDIAASDWGAPARDAASGGHVLFAPIAGAWRGENDAEPPGLWKIDSRPTKAEDAALSKALAPPRDDRWARADVTGPRARMHTLAAEGVVCAVAAAVDPERDDRAIVQALAVDKSSGTVRWKTSVDRVALRGMLGEGARVARRANGEVLFQAVQADGTPSSDLVCAKPEGGIDSLPLGNAKRFVLDAALGELVLAHAEGKSGRVLVSAFEIDKGRRLLGRRAALRWSYETDDLGGSTTVYAGAGNVVVRGARAIVALRA